MNFYSIILILAGVLQEAITKPENNKQERLSAQKLVEQINQNQNLWKAKRYEQFEMMSFEEKKRLMGALRENTVKDNLIKKSKDQSYGEIPEEFDARKQWPRCYSIKSIRDQTACGSCWAIAAAEAISDRICIASNRSIQVTISTRDIMSCCSDCGYGCNGGYPSRAWKYWVTNGVVTGSDYITNSGCQPYPLPPCGGTHPPCPPDGYKTPKCLTTCSRGYSKTYVNDKYYGKRYYDIMGERDIQEEIMENGPVEASFDVYEDFVQYYRGIYKYQEGRLLGGHSVKIVGWGVEKGTKYWLIANSWNDGWGENGFFRMVRGSNDCGIESEVSAGIPKL